METAGSHFFFWKMEQCEMGARAEFKYPDRNWLVSIYQPELRENVRPMVNNMIKFFRGTNPLLKELNTFLATGTAYP